MHLTKCLVTLRGEPYHLLPQARRHLTRISLLAGGRKARLKYAEQGEHLALQVFREQHVETCTVCAPSISFVAAAS